MKKIISVFLISSMILSMTGCVVVKKKAKTPPPTTEATVTTTAPVTTITTSATTTKAVTTTPATTTAVATTSATKTSAISTDEGSELLDSIYDKLFSDSDGSTVETTRPATTNSKPDVKLGNFSGTPEVEWGTYSISADVEPVLGAEEYIFSIDSKKFTDDGDIKTVATSRPSVSIKYSEVPPRYLYVRVTARKGEEKVSTDYIYDTYRASARGSASYIEGKTLIVTVFTDDPTTKWTDSDADKQAMDESWESMHRAAEWLTESTEKYGVKSEFIWDWKKHGDLKYTASIDLELDIEESDSNYKGVDEWDDGSYEKMQIRNARNRYIGENIDTDSLLEKYEADNIIYMFVVNTTSDNIANNHAESSDMGRKFGLNYDESVTIYVKEEGHTARADTYAHEILHCFGAPDLYCESDIIPKAYIDYCSKNGCDSIMYYGRSEDNITKKFTDIEAYYTGLVDHCDVAEKWGFLESNYIAGKIR